MRILIIAAVVVLIFLFAFLLNRYFFYPLFFKSRLTHSEILNFFQNKNLILVSSEEVSKKETKNFTKIGEISHKLFFYKSYYKVVLYSKSQKEFTLYWVFTKSLATLFFHPEKTIEFVKETDINLLKELKKEYGFNYIEINDTCPGCNLKISFEENICHNCGLYFM